MSVNHKIDELEAKMKAFVGKWLEVNEKLLTVTREKEELQRQLDAFSVKGIQPGSEQPTSVSDTSDTQAVRAELDKYIHQVDECIDLVNQL